MGERVLLVDDDENILYGYQRVLRSRFDMDLALGGEQAIGMVERRGPFAVIVADMRMPGMSGLDLLTEMRARFPDTSRIMLTGETDLKTAMDAVNHGRVFRFLTKPCPAEELELAIRAGLRQHELMAAERELLEQTLTGAVTVLSDLLAGADPGMFSRSRLLRERGAKLARALGCEEAWALEIAALLAPIGRIILPASALRATGRAGEAALFAAVPEVWAKLLQAIPRLDGVARMIRYQGKGYDGSGLPEDGVRGDAIPLGARILKVLWDFADLEASRRSRLVALEEMRLRSKTYDPAVLEALGSLLSADSPAPKAQDVRWRGLRPGMVLVSGVQAEDGGILLPAGLRPGPGHLELLARLADFVKIQEPIPVLLSGEDRHEA